jgi:hypothetical protein
MKSGQGNTTLRSDDQAVASAQHSMGARAARRGLPYVTAVGSLSAFGLLHQPGRVRERRVAEEHRRPNE